MTRAITKTTRHNSVTLPADRENLHISTIDLAVTFLSNLSNNLYQPDAGIFCFAVKYGDDDYSEVYSVFNFGAKAAIYRVIKDHGVESVGKFLTIKDYLELIDVFMMD